MSYSEYKDLYERAQSSGKYQMFIVDIANSRKLPDKEALNTRLKLMDIFEKITNRVENELGILHVNNHPLFAKNNYFMLGDLFGFCVTSGCNKLVQKIIDEELNDFDLPYHSGTARYDTDDWGRGGKEYYFGYCISQLEDDTKEIILNNSPVEER